MMSYNEFLKNIEHTSCINKLCEGRMFKGFRYIFIADICYHIMKNNNNR